MSSSGRVLLFIADETLLGALTDDLRREGYQVDRCDNLETCQHVSSHYDHDIAFIQAGEDDLDTIKAVAACVTPGARMVVVLNDPDPAVTEQLEMHGMQVAAFPQDSASLVELLREDEVD